MPDVIHTIQKGDTLSQIGEKYGLSWQQIYFHERNQAFRERCPNPNIIWPGLEIFIAETFVGTRYDRELEI